MLPPPRRSKPVPSVIPRKSKTPPLSFRGGRRPTKESTLHSASLPGNKPFVTSGFRPQLQQINLSSRPQMRKIGLVGHSARRRGNDFAHFGRFTGRVCNRTALRGTFSAFAAGQVVWQPEMASQLSCRASTSETWSPVLWTMIS